MDFEWEQYSPAQIHNEGNNTSIGNYIAELANKEPKSNLEKKYGNYYDYYKTAKNLTPFLPNGAKIYGGLSLAEYGANWMLGE